MQKSGVAHDTALSPLVPYRSASPALLASMDSGADHRDPRMVSTAPSTATATQKLADGHDTALSPVSTSERGADHVPPEKVMARPWSSTATQNRAVGHDTAKATSGLTFFEWAWAGLSAR